LGVWVELALPGIGHLPQGRATGRRLADEGDDPDLAAALRTEQRENLIDAGEQQSPGVSRRLAMDRLFCGLCRLG
jgi:hypothetical protein